MKMDSEHYSEYWENVDCNPYSGSETWSTLKPDAEAIEHMPPNYKRGAMSMCIGTECAYKWVGDTWVEM